MNTLKTVKMALLEAKHKLAGDDAAVADIYRLINKFEAEGKRPYYIYDNVSGAKLGMSQAPVFERRFAMFKGDILAMFANYKGRASTPKAEKPVKESKRSYKRKDKVADGTPTGNTFMMETLATDKDGNPTEQRVTVTARGKVVTSKKIALVDSVE
jgi:hypothetical protein